MNSLSSNHLPQNGSFLCVVQGSFLFTIKILHINIMNTMLAVKISKETQQSKNTKRQHERFNSQFKSSVERCDTVAALRGSASKFCTETVYESTTGAEPLKRAFVLTSSWTTVCIM